MEETEETAADKKADEKGRQCHGLLLNESKQGNSDY